MWTMLLALLRKARAFFQHLFGFKPNIPSAVENKDVEKFSPPISKTAEKPLALPITNKYENIDWENAPPQYEKRFGVLSYRERQFFKILLNLINNEYHLLSMVRMGDVLRLSSSQTNERKFYRSNIFCKHFDFVLCEKSKFEPVLVIELDDPKHNWEHRWQADNFKDKACEVAGLPLLRIKVQNSYDGAELKKQIRQMLAKSTPIEEPKPPRQFGSAKGLIEMADDFDQSDL